MKLKILYNAVDSEATGSYRLLNPLFELQNQGLAELQVVSNVDMRAQLKWADLLVLQCLMGPQQLLMLPKVKEAGVPVVIDYDDNFEALPIHRLETLGMTSDEVGNNWRQYLQLADLVTVPCQDLKAVVNKYTDKVVLLPNYVLQREFELSRDYSPGDEGIRILYSCSDSHLEDFKWIGSVLKRLGETYPQVTIISHGTLNFTYHFPTYTGKAEHHLYTSYQNYHHKLQEIAPNICIAPLLNNPHAVCRSDIKYKQAGCIKAAFIASNLGPYKEAVNHGKTGFLAGNRLTWWWYLRKLIQKPQLIKEMGLAAHKEVSGLILEDHVNEWYETYLALAAKNLGDRVAK